MKSALPRRRFLARTLAAGAAAALPARRLRAVSADPVPSITVRTLGTGAADHDWKRIGEPGVRGSAATLVDGHVLIDCGTTGYANLTRFDIPPRALTDLLITHSHADHFDPDQILNVLEARGPDLPPLGIWASPQALATLARALPGRRFTGHPLVAGTAFDVGRLHVTALPANHVLPDPSEQALHFLVETPCGTLLYALDGAWLLKQARLLIGKRRLDMIIWDATVAHSGDFRAFEHNDLAMIGLMMASLTTTGAVDSGTVCVLDHIARTLWPADPQEAGRLASERGWTLAEDGMTLHFRRLPH
ncbi:MAG: MBL fold metallo-hydrolase [Kiritimatiellia bacterium]